MKTEIADNLKLWNDHEATPADMVKWVKQGTYQYAAIDAYHRIKQATEAWGPYGQKWGLRECEWDQITGEVFEKDRTTKEIVSRAPGVVGIVLRANFFYPDGCFPIAVDDAYRPSGDTYKKLTTGAITKALSYLGFSAEIFMGKFADEITLQKERSKFDTETKHENTVKLLMNLLEAGIGCQNEQDMLDVMRWAHFENVDVMQTVFDKDGFPAHAMNGIREKRLEVDVPWPAVLPLAKEKANDEKHNT